MSKQTEKINKNKNMSKQTLPSSGFRPRAYCERGVGVTEGLLERDT